jgi:hypothetical protein
MQKLTARKFHGVHPWRHQSYPDFKAILIFMPPKDA